MWFNKRIDLIQDRLEEHPELFDGPIRLVPETVKKHVDCSIKPVVCPACRLPYALMSKVKGELDKMEQNNILKNIQNLQTG